MGSKKMFVDHLDEKLKLNLLWDGILVGLVSGFVALAYRFMLSKISVLRHILYDVEGTKILLVLGLFFLLGYIMSIFLKWAPLSGGSGIPQIRGELMAKSDMECMPTLISKFIGGGIANVAGLSLGREGPSIQIGGTMAKLLGKVLKKNPLEMNYMITAGASAGLSAAFNAPIAGALFALEEMHKSFSHYIMVPCVIASILANYISFHFMGVEPAFSFKVTENLPIELFPVVILLGIVTGLIGVLFNIGLDKGANIMSSIPLSKGWVLGILLVLTYPLGKVFPDVLSGGHHFVEEMSKGMFSAKPLIILLIVKIIFTWISYGSGAQGGIFLPTLVLGAAGGLIVFYILEPYIGIEGYEVNFIILGMVGILTSVVRAPIMSILLVTEMTGSFTQLISITIISIVSFLIAESCGNSPIYETLYHKFLDTIDVKEDSYVDDFSMSAYTLTPISLIVGYSLGELTFPTHFIILSIEREGQEFLPTSEDILMPGDHVLVVHHKNEKEEVEQYFQSEKDL
ncbi:MAG: ClC family H(+)/Cl(-) exchange transporter [Tissierellia bacterium]|nr:ClC family H(+)/Cl(-) exchange transporter [Tissierellia bacterium]